MKAPNLSYADSKISTIKFIVAIASFCLLLAAPAAAQKQRATPAVNPNLAGSASQSAIHVDQQTG